MNLNQRALKRMFEIADEKIGSQLYKKVEMSHSTLNNLKGLPENVQMSSLMDLADAIEVPLPIIMADVFEEGDVKESLKVDFKKVEGIINGLVDMFYADDVKID